MTTVSAEKLIHAPLHLAYRAFTNSTSLREWLCDVATVDLHPGGRIYLWWRGDFYSSGHYLELEQDKKVRFRWFSSIDPAPTEVTVSFVEQEGGTVVRMVHSLPDDPVWVEKAESFRQEWDDSLGNLKSVLETGVDLRIANRPMLGIVPGDFTPEQAKVLGVPVSEGMRLDGVLDGMGAQKAGLQKDDVLVEMAGKVISSDFNSLPNAIAGKKGGDPVTVVFYRGPEKKTITMELSKRPMPDVPFDAVNLARQARALYDAALSELEKCFEGVSDAEALARPAPDGWSALEVVAHLLHGERFNQIYLSNLVDGYELVNDGFGTNIHAYNQATVAAYPTVTAMLGALRAGIEETLAFVSFLPADFVANKGSYHRFASGLLQPNFHITAHIEQIQAAIAAARK
jgi:uncharacterized protein YndB with AHSA1/START domain